MLEEVRQPAPAQEKSAKPYEENQSYRDMISHLEKGGDPQEILSIVKAALEHYPEWFSRDFKNRIGVWEENIAPSGATSQGSIDFLKKTITEFWSVIYNGGKDPRVQIYFEEEPQSKWPEDLRAS